MGFLRERRPPLPDTDRQSKQSNLQSERTKVVPIQFAEEPNYKQDCNPAAQDQLWREAVKVGGQFGLKLGYPVIQEHEPALCTYERDKNFIRTEQPGPAPSPGR